MPKNQAISDLPGSEAQVYRRECPQRRRIDIVDPMNSIGDSTDRCFGIFRGASLQTHVKNTLPRCIEMPLRNPVHCRRTTQETTACRDRLVYRVRPDRVRAGATPG